MIDFPTPIALRADDAGAFPAFTAGCLAAARAGAVKNISVMVPPAHFAAAAIELATLPDDIEFGLHVTLNCEWIGERWRSCASRHDIPDLVDAEGYLRFKQPSEIEDAAVPLAQLLTEVRAQLARLRATGLRVSYLDEHMGVGWIQNRKFHNALVSLCQEEDLVAADTLNRTPISRLSTASPSSMAIAHPAIPGPDILNLRLRPSDEPATIAAGRARELDQLLAIPSTPGILPIGIRATARMAAQRAGH